MSKTRSVYAVDGVDVEEEGRFSAMAGEMCKSTSGNSPFVEVRDLAGGYFRGPRVFRFVNRPEGAWEDGAPDGIGTKTIVIDAAFSHRQASRDLVAMTAGDITRWGGKPLVFFNVLDVSTLGKEGSETNKAYRELIGGLAEVAKEQEFVCHRGETAQLGPCVGSENRGAVTKFNWSGFMIGLYLEDRVITGSTLAPGQAVVALREEGFRSNGTSSVRKAFCMKYGQMWWKNPEAERAIQLATRPSTLYDKFLADMNGWQYPAVGTPTFHFHAIAHITGGGIVEKFARDMLFPRGLSAHLTNLYEPPLIMRDVVEWRGMGDEECYRALGCGNGALVVIEDREVPAFMYFADQYGIQARRCGEIVSNDNPLLQIRSGFTGDMLTYSENK